MTPRSTGPTVVPAGPQDVPPASIEVLSEMNQPKQPIVAQPQAEPMETTPPASLEVLAAIVRECGVEPSWLLFGEYDADTHTDALDCAGKVRGKDLVLSATARLYARERELHNARATFNSSASPPSLVQVDRGQQLQESQ